MLSINKQSANLGTIKMALFVATQVPALKGSNAWHKCNQLLNWITQFDSDDTIVITNDENIVVTKGE